MERRPAACFLGVVGGPAPAPARRTCACSASRRPSGGDGPSCNVNGCIQEVHSELQLYSKILLRPSDIVEESRRRRPLRKTRRLVVLAACSSRSISYQRVKSEYMDICQKHPRVTFLMIEAEKFPDIVRNQLHVRSLPTFILFNNGRRIDHFDARDRGHMEQFIIDNE